MIVEFYCKIKQLQMFAVLNVATQYLLMMRYVTMETEPTIEVVFRIVLEFSQAGTAHLL